MLPPDSSGKIPDLYFCIDQKSFYASVECVERGLEKSPGVF